MTREEAIRRLTNIERHIAIHTEQDKRDFSALEMAISALEEKPCIYDLKNRYCPRLNEHGMLTYPQEPCDDAVSREAVIKAVDAHTNEDGTLDDDISVILEDLPPVTQKPKYWIDKDNKLYKMPDDLPSVTPKPTECEDAISRQAVLEKLNEWDWQDLYLPVHFKEYIIDELPSVTQSGKWIPVSERLPEDEQEILFSTKTGRVHSGKYHDDDSANQWYSHRDKCRAWNNVVSAWMPLPKPFEPQESKDIGSEAALIIHEEIINKYK